ncbi:hypothetical protein OG884_35905 [Streptosporangium sp. NBC_01755]|nr:MULTISPECIES: hypothetical protein [unclassified Streptosporangium]WSA28412.1 hypothetical protein OIE13_11355 [Streptosporangium sp. NBC_01810]WSD00098.1 hypothetical protein OG884_35905 [Streptosporangium sp. NBC_01755]
MAKDLAAEIAAKVRPQLEMVIRHHVDGAAPQLARDAVNDIARDLL